MDNLIGQKIYIIFKHIWTESDTNEKEYSFDNAFLTLEEAITYIIKNFLDTKDDIGIYGSLFINILIFDSDIEQPESDLYWEPKYDCWINKGAFKSVSKENIISSLISKTC